MASSGRTCDSNRFSGNKSHESAMSGRRKKALSHQRRGVVGEGVVPSPTKPEVCDNMRHPERKPKREVTKRKPTTRSWSLRSRRAILHTTYGPSTGTTNMSTCPLNQLAPRSKMPNSFGRKLGGELWGQVGEQQGFLHMWPMTTSTGVPCVKKGAKSGTRPCAATHTKPWCEFHTGACLGEVCRKSIAPALRVASRTVQTI